MFAALFALLVALPVAAQSTPLVAFVNSSGQLIVSSGDGGYRWIITNPGETLAGDYRWSPDGNVLYFAVNSGGAVSLRAADVRQQSVGEIGQLPGQLISLSPDGAFTFYQNADGSYGLQSTTGAAPALTPVRNDLGARYSGLWADVGAVVAYWGYAGNSLLSVTDAADGETVTLDSGRSAPIAPLVWRPGTLELIYRDAGGFVRLADLSCLQATCATNPLEAGIALASADADVSTDGTWLFFRSGDSISAIDFRCVSGDVCLNSSVPMVTNAAPQTAVTRAATTLVYTGYSQNPNDPNDREVRVVSILCLNGGACSPQTVASGAVAGAVSFDARYAVVETPAGLNSLDLTSGALAYLSDRGAPLTGARWQR
ncbi:MAG: hypothetical protein IT319_19625 [Anaerolineae bacterium]|nr:hypothetical protein [Anaerolineae bacterium]